MSALSYAIETGDFLALASTIADRSFDHIITDPPYLPHTHDNYVQGGGTGKRRGVKKTVSTKRDLSFNALTPAHRAQWAHEMARIARRWVVAFTDAEGFAGWKTDMEAAGLEYVRQLVWVRGGLDIDQANAEQALRGNKGAPQMTGDRPAAGHELMILCHVKGTRMRWNGRGAARDGTGGQGGGGSVYFADIVTAAAGRLQDAQKPLPLITELMRDLTNPGDSVFDPFVGSGTTVKVAMLEGRSARGIELDPARAATARSRCCL